MSALEKSTFAKIFEGADLCLAHALDVPMLVLVYTAMDALAWALYGEQSNGVRERFTALCESYILPGSGIRCAALELYAARCSVLHTLGWESELSRTGKARSVFYSFGNDDPSLAQAALELASPGKFVCLKANDLLAALKEAVAAISTLAQGRSLAGGWASAILRAVPVLVLRKNVTILSTLGNTMRHDLVSSYCAGKRP